MAFHLDFTDEAVQDIAKHKKTGNKAVLTKILTLLEELKEHPFTGTGKPEPLKHHLSGKWSRKIDKVNRFVYNVENNTLHIYSLKGHY